MSEQLKEIESVIENIEKIYYDKWKTQELNLLLDSFYGSGHVDWLIERIKQLEKICQYYADPTIYDAREGMAILKDCGDKAREGLK